MAGALIAIAIGAGLLVLQSMDAEAKLEARPATVLARKTRTAIRQPLGVIALVPVAWTMIGLASAAIAFVPFRRLAPLLGRSLGTVAMVPVVPSAQLRRAAAIGHAIAVAAKYAPFRSNCLPQALAAATLCRWAGIPYAAFLGASLSGSGESGMSAHAWIQSGRVSVTGGRGSFKLYNVVACFVPRGVDV